MAAINKTQLWLPGVIPVMLMLFGCSFSGRESPSVAAPTETTAKPQALSPISSPSPSFSPVSTPSPSATFKPSATPPPSPAPLPPIHAIRLDYADYTASRAGMNNLETLLRQSGINLVALGAGRVDWAYFKWPNRPENWSGDVVSSGIDFLAEDAARFHAWARVDAVVDVFAPKYIQMHPGAAALSWLGEPSPYLVNTMDLVDGEFGRLLLDMIMAIAANYPVDSISLTELMYYTDGYGEIDKAAYMTYTGNKDWPRLTNGLVNIDDPSIGEWRSREISKWLKQARAITSRYGKQLFIDVAVSWKSLGNLGAEHGTRYDILLEQADRVVVWNYFALNGFAPESSEQLAQVLRQEVGTRAILSIGLWNKNGTTITPAQLEASILASQKGGIQDLWITPSLLMTDAHWKVLIRLWGAP